MDGVIENPTKAFGVKEFTVKDNFGVT